MILIVRLATLFCCVLAITFISTVVLRRLRVTHPIEWLLGLGVLNLSQIVLVLETLSLLHLMRPVPMIVAHLITTVPFAVYAVRCRLRLLPEFRGTREGWAGIDRRLKVFSGIVASGALVVLVSALALPPTNHDSLTYHLARVGYYLQQGSLESFPTANVRQTVYPANAELAILWQVLLLRSDHTAGLVQWLSAVGAILGVYLLARRLGFSSNRSFFSALAFFTFPQVVLQASSTQNDLFVANLLVAAFAFAACCGKSRVGMGRYAVLAGLAFGLAVGSKSTALLLTPGFALFCLACHLPIDRIRLKGLAVLALFSTTAVLLFGSYFYLQNLRLYGSPSGPAGFSRLVLLDRVEASTAWSNSGRLLLQMASPGGLLAPGVTQPLEQVYRRVTETLFEAGVFRKRLPGIDFPGGNWDLFPPTAIQEDFTWFGPVFGWLGFPLIIGLAFWPQRRDIRHRVLALASLSFLAICAFFLRWDPWGARRAICMVAIAAPLLGFLYPLAQSGLRSFWAYFLLCFCALTLFNGVVHNERKPLGRLPEMIMEDRRTLAIGPRPQILGFVRLLDGLGLEGKRIGLISPTEDEVEYFFFGENFERRIIPLTFGTRKFDSSGFRGLDALLFLGSRQRFLLDRPTGNAADFYADTDLTPVISRLRSGKDWIAVVDEDALGYLFVRQGLRYDRAVLSSLPDTLGARRDGESDNWVSDHFSLRVRVDRARPLVEFRGETASPRDPSRFEVAVREEVTLREVKALGPGAFSHTLSLASLVPRLEGRYVTIDIKSDFSTSRDSRQVSWRLLDVQLKGTELPDFRPVSVWWSDKWVGKEFAVRVKADRQRPQLEFEGNCPESVLRLIVREEGSVLADLTPLPNERFKEVLDLEPVFARAKASDILLRFEVDATFNPKKLGIAEDDRDLGWRLYSLRLVARSGKK